MYSCINLTYSPDFINIYLKKEGASIAYCYMQLENPVQKYYKC